ncbi:FAD-dependent oxidoreductase [Geminicoccus roseus]|uniref:FAD-dependent oxidoreductase n=1 Tax=Geminicoccus roseus TaxID=404900 RepID=UPI00040074B7|nr:FAD-dependent oxidoreductase [Geminicoccus roseus]
MRVAVIGAGVAGLTAALAFARRGCEVRVYERGPSLGATSCSRYAGGMLAPWCERESAEPQVVELGREALAYWPKVHPGTLQHGSLVLAPRRDERELDRFARRTSRYQTLDADGLAELEPDLAGRFGRGLFFADEAHLDPRAALPSLADRLAEQGVPIRFGVDALAEPPKADLRVDCRGLAARDRLADLRGVKGEMLILRCRDVTLNRPVRLLHPRFPLYIVPRPDNLFMVGATMIESDERSRVTARSMVELLNAAYALHPAFGEAEIVEIGADVRPAFADNLPRVRRDGDNLYLNGLFRHGFLLSPALARIATELVLDNQQIQGITEITGGHK